MTEDAFDPTPADVAWLRGIRMPYLVDRLDDLPDDFEPPGIDELRDPHPERDPEELERFMKLVAEGS